MSNNGQGNTTELVSFEEMDQEGGDGGSPSKAEQLMTFLSNKLDGEALGEAREILGLPKDLSNAELLTEIRKELKKKEEDEDEEEKKKKEMAAKDDEYEYPDEKTKKGADPDYQTFMKSCMKSGKSLKECAAEYKEKKKEPSEKEAAEVERLAASEWKAEIDAAKKKKEDKDEDEYPEPVKKKMQELQSEIDALKELNRKAGIDSKVDAMLNEKHLTPKQAGEIRKLMYKLPDAEHEGILNIFRSQVISVQQDIGLQLEKEQISADDRKKLIHSHGLDRLMEEKGGRLPGAE